MSGSKIKTPSRKDQKNVVKGMVQPVIKYLDDNYGSDITDRILNDIDHDRLYFDDLNGFMPIETTDKLFESAKKYTGDSDFPYTMGKNIFRYMNPLQSKVMATFATPHLLFMNMSKVEQKIVKTTCVEATRLAPGRYKMRISFRDKYREPESACRNRHGTYEALTTIFKLPYAKVEHPRCAFRGDPNCEYIVTIPETWFQWVFRASLLLAVIGMLSGILFLFTGALPAGVVTAVSPLVSMSLYILFNHQRFKEGVKWLKEAEHTIEQQSRQLSLDNRRTGYLHDLTVKLNREFHCRVISNEVARVIVENFNYGASQIWLTKDNNFFCSGLYGYEEEFRETVLNTKYSIFEGMNYPEGFVVKVLKNRETLLINDFQKATKSFTEQSRKLFAYMDVSSAIIIPLADTEGAFGMLVGINKSGKKVSYTDKILFETITHIVSNSLHKARLYESMEEKIAIRDKEIRHHQKQVILAREMAVQNEKMSALGQMAAGIAHEINNPLNFLFNIIPELKKDFMVLKRISGIAKEHVPEKHRDEFGAITEQYQLETHLEEGDEVFEYFDKALNKAVKTANSLKVFARTTINDDYVSEELFLLVEQAIGLIPAKYFSSIQLSVKIPQEIRVTVNKIEFQQVLINLLNNAIEATEGENIITVSATEEQNQAVSIIVEDQGKGVLDEHVSLIFNPFFTTKDPQKHTGLGLTIAKELLKKHGGDIALLKIRDKGVVFQITISKKSFE